jgi:flagellar hook-basal body complex protein FliE
MMNPIIPPRLNIPMIQVPGVSPASPGQAADSGSAFKAIFANSVQQIQDSQQIADHTIEQFLSGENQDLHEVAIASQKAELSFEFYLQARNKVVAAYQEVMKIQL